MRSIGLLCLVATLGGAPLQCSSEPDFSERRAETPGEALYALAQRFKEQGDERAWRRTLEFLVQRYPNSRFAVMAKDDLKRSSAASDSKRRLSDRSTGSETNRAP